MTLSAFTVTIMTLDDSPHNTLPLAPLEIRNRLANGASGTLASIFSDAAGTFTITQTGATTDSLGQFTFYASPAPYNAVFDNNGTPVISAIDVGLTTVAFASAIDRLNPDTLAIWQADTSALAGDVVTTKARSTGNGGGATGDVIVGTGSANGFEIVAHNTLDLSWVLRFYGVVIVETLGDPTDVNVRSAAAALSVSSDTVIKSPKLQRLTTLYTVGAGGDFSTINEAITRLSADIKTYVNEGLIGEISLLTGFVIAEQVIVGNGLDLSWITITSVDAVVSIDHTAIILPIYTGEVLFPIFGAHHSSTTPTIGFQAEYDDNTTAKDGVVCLHDSEVNLLPESGIRKCDTGMYIGYGSRAYCNIPFIRLGSGGSGTALLGADFSFCKSNAVVFSHESTGDIARTQGHHCDGDHGLFALWACTVNAYQSDFGFTVNGDAVSARDGSTINARETDANDSQRGFHVVHNGKINARFSGTTFGQLGAKNCTINGLVGSDGGSITAQDTVLTNCALAILSTAGCVITATDADMSGSAVGISAVDTGEVSARAIKGNNIPGTAVSGESAAIIDVHLGEFLNCGADIINANAASVICATTITGDAAGKAGEAFRASTIDLRGSTFTAGGINSGEMSHINFQSGTADTISVTRGGLVNAGSATGTLSQTANTVTAAGIIFK